MSKRKNRFKKENIKRYIAQAREPQTEAPEDNAMLAHLMRHINMHPSAGLTPAKAAEILKQAERGSLIAQSDLAFDMEEKDAHLQSENAKRRRALHGLSYQIKPPRNATKEEIYDTDMLNEIVTDFNFMDDVIFDATDAILKGTCAQEIMGYEEVEGLMLPCGVEYRELSLFQVSQYDRNELRLRSFDDPNGAELNPFGWIVHNAKSKSGYLGTTGLVRSLVFPFIFKNYSIRDLAEFLEIYGLPVRLGQYSSGATEKEKATLLKAVMSIGHNAGGIIPMGMKIDFQQAATGSSDPFLAMVSWAELSMSKAILGGTLTSQADGATSTNALGNVHNEVRKEIRDSDAKQLAKTLTRDLILPIYAMNCSSYSTPHRVPRFIFDTNEPEDLGMYAQSIPALVNAGMKIPTQWLHDKLQIPVADKDEPVLQPQAQAPMMPAFLSAQIMPPPVQGLAALSARQQAEHENLAAMPAAITGEQWQKAINPVIEPIIKLIQEQGLEAAKEQAAVLYADMNDDELADIIHRATFVADLAGRVNAVN